MIEVTFPFIYKASVYYFDSPIVMFLVFDEPGYKCLF